ncbi:MAG: hypothetical protein Q8N23_01305 [Archangium sp.]|nr:hypothetical protein [Archangium sp.]MDP3151274.1 hypothetical protein [Archangium sp.]MDP3569200.1 hypothetical protein [Archangium sp.]
MSTRVPPSSKPPQGQPSAAQRARRSTRPQAASDKPKPIKAGGAQAGDEPLNSPEAQLWAGQDMDRSLEIRASDIEQRMAEINQSEQAEKEEGAEHTAELHEAAQKDEKKSLFKIFSWQKAAPRPQTDGKSALQKQQEAKQEALKKLPGFKPTVPTNLTGVSASRLQQVGAVKSLLSGQSATNERPPDAFALLKDAREKGTLFVEDALADGHSEDQEDPEHAAAVEACIAQCFGVRGILRIGPGHNDKNEPIIVIATTHGFAEASLAKVPEKVHRFATLIAIPFDLLPLKRER